MNIPKMDYIIVTLNDINTIKETIGSIRKQENVNDLIVVCSEGCSDGTLSLIKEMYMSNVGVDVFLTEDVGLAFARKLGIEYVDAEFFVFVDGDVILKDGWIEGMWKYMGKNIGGIYGSLYRNRDQKVDLYKNFKDKKLEKTRMYTHNTIIRTDIVKDWNPPPHINSYEDYMLTQHIRKKGYDCFNVPVFSYHDHELDPFKEAVWGSAGARTTGFYKSFKDPVKKSIYTIGGGFKRTLRSGKFSFLKNSLLKGVGIIAGYLNSRSCRKKGDLYE